jgi:hypothetical protein
MYWTLQNLKGSEKKQYIVHYGSKFSAATVLGDTRVLTLQHKGDLEWNF